MQQLEMESNEHVPTPDESNASAEVVPLNEAVSRFKAMAKLLNDIAGVNPRTTQALDELEKALQKVPSGSTFGESLDEARAVLGETINVVRGERAAAFGRIEADFIRAELDRGKSVREQNEGWRIGKIEFQFRRPQAMARALYNHEEIVGWKPIGELSDLEKLESAALKLLDSAELPSEMLGATFWSAYEGERDRREQDEKSRPDLVPLPDFYRELRSAIVRFELAGQKPDRRLQYIDLPRWKFLYNVDRYRTLGTSLPSDQRLGFQTGSQQDVQRGLGFSINGLDATQDYKIVCYVTAV